MWYYFKTILLIMILTFFLAYVGKIAGGEIGMLIALAIGLGVNFISYFFSDKIVLTMYRAQEVKENDYPELYNMVKSLSQKAGIPMPRVYIINEDQPNAFATGRDPKNSAVAFTRGILELLNYEELMGVTAHELAHIKNRDILISTIAAGIAMAITILIDMLRWTIIFTTSKDNERNILADLILIFVAPIIALLIQLAVSRTREYLADKTGAQIVGNPIYLANALEKLDYYSKQIPLNRYSPATSHMFIVNPENFLALFSTHPPIKERIRRLRSMI
ncbi:MAG: zinc metalloprotease HtpX [Candidatus Calescibacterium sp.]|nr:zinc metalloprotease HtpX [Candidatus Calescibacterium sp.]MCX7972241.1 zinc metalloprotease HtpX [bacterium]MDW8195158.1 zinc metalloprotease HtpX [Candidatus Calescibacterium sp.]